MNVREALIRCSDGSTLKGKVNIGEKSSRLSAWFISNKDPFVTVFDATVDGETDKVIIVNKDHIIWAIPVDD